MFLSLVLKAETCSVKDIEQGYLLPADYESAMYICVGGGELLYVGISISPVFRLRQHLQMTPSRQRSLFSDGIKRNSPASSDWMIAFPSGIQLVNWMNLQHPEIFNPKAAKAQLRKEGPISISEICESRIVSTYKPIFNISKGAFHEKG